MLAFNGCIPPVCRSLLLWSEGPLTYAFSQLTVSFRDNKLIPVGASIGNLSARPQSPTLHITSVREGYSIPNYLYFVFGLVLSNEKHQAPRAFTLPLENGPHASCLLECAVRKALRTSVTNGFSFMC